MLPNFVCVGAEKAGTTPLFRVLEQHRDVFMPRHKETHFFTEQWHWKPIAVYEAHHFRGGALERAVGESTPDYMRYPEVPARLHQVLGPDLKLIFCLRDPVRRAFSQYHLCCRLLEETESFETAITLESQRIAADPIFGRRRAYLGASRYQEQIERFLPFFPRENMFFMVLEEDFRSERARTVARLFDFLGVGPDRKVKLEVQDTSNRAPLIRVSTAAKPLRQKLKGSFKLLPPGSLAIQTGNAWSNAVIERPSRAIERHLRHLATHLTERLDEVAVQRLYREEFKDEIGRLEEFLGRDLASWRHD